MFKLTNHEVFSLLHYQITDANAYRRSNTEQPQEEKNYEKEMVYHN